MKINCSDQLNEQRKKKSRKTTKKHKSTIKQSKIKHKTQDMK